MDVGAHRPEPELDPAKPVQRRVDGRAKHLLAEGHFSCRRSWWAAAVGGPVRALGPGPERSPKASHPSSRLRPSPMTRCLRPPGRTGAGSRRSRAGAAGRQDGAGCRPAGRWRLGRHCWRPPRWPPDPGPCPGPCRGLHRRRCRRPRCGSRRRLSVVDPAPSEAGGRTGRDLSGGSAQSSSAGSSGSSAPSGWSSPPASSSNPSSSNPSSL